MLGFLYLLGFAILILSAMVAGLIAGLLAGLVRWAVTRRKGSLWRLSVPPVLSGALGGVAGGLFGVIQGWLQQFRTCQTFPDCQFEAASHAFILGLAGTVLGAIAGAALIALYLISRPLSRHKPKP